MASMVVVERPWPNLIIAAAVAVAVAEEEEGDSDSNPIDAVLFVGISLIIGVAVKHLLRGTRVPYTVALLVIGVAIGALEYGTNHGLGRVGDGIRIWANIDSDLLLAVFLPVLLFESSFLMEWHPIKESSTILSKLLLPQIFEKMAMHELRSLVAERSTLSTYVTGESFEVPQNMIGLLLEGFIQTLGALEHITAPVALIPGDCSFRMSELEDSGGIGMLNCIIKKGTLVIYRHFIPIPKLHSVNQIDMIPIPLTHFIPILPTKQVVKPDSILFQFLQSQIHLTDVIPSKNILQTKRHLRKSQSTSRLNLQRKWQSTSI